MFLKAPEPREEAVIPHGNFVNLPDDEKRQYENRVVTFFLTRLQVTSLFPAFPPSSPPSDPESLQGMTAGVASNSAQLNPKLAASRCLPGLPVAKPDAVGPVSIQEFLCAHSNSADRHKND